MLRMIWQYLRNDYARRRFGLDQADIQHIRADLRFRLALVEYAYFGKSGKKVAQRLAELKTLLGDRAIHRYLRSLDPDLRTQFVERFQSRRRDAHAGTAPGSGDARPLRMSTSSAAAGQEAWTQASPLGSNVVPINFVTRRDADSTEGEGSRADESSVKTNE